MDDGKKNDSKLIILQALNKEYSNIELTDDEQKLKDRLLSVEKKLDSVDNVINSINDESSKTIFSDEVFDTIIGAIAVTAATSILAEFFDIPKRDVDDLLI